MTQRRGRDDGSWLALPHGYKLTVSLGLHPGGARWRKSFSGATKRECRDKRDAYLALNRIGIAPSDEPLRTYLPAWLLGRKDTWRSSTYAGARSIVHSRLVPMLGAVTLSELRVEHVRKMMLAIVSGGRSARYANHCRSILGSAMKDAMREGRVVRNVVSLARSLPERARDLEPLSVEEVHRLLDHVQGTWLYAPIYVAVALGLRQGELLGLCWPDVGAQIRVRNTLHRIDRVYVLEEPKTKASRRELPAGPVTAVLAAVKVEQDEAKRGRWEPWPYDLVFRTPHGPMNGTTLTHHYQAALKAIGAGEHRWHDLRHTCATFLLSEGVEPAVIRDILGHASITTTLNVYAQIIPRLKAGALDRVSMLLESSITERVGTSVAPGER